MQNKLRRRFDDGLDNDKDGKLDFADPGCLVLDVDGDQQLNQDDTDDDGDGYADTAEAHVGTVSQERCGTGGWPADLNGMGMSANRVDVLDVTSYLAPVRRLGTDMGSLPGNGRWDLVPGKGLFSTDINVVDLVSVITTASAWNGGVRAFNGPPCPDAP